MDKRLKGLNAGQIAAVEKEFVRMAQEADAAGHDVGAIATQLEHIRAAAATAAVEVKKVNTEAKAAGQEGGSHLKAVLSGIGGELQNLAEKIPGVSEIGAVAGAAVPEVAALAAILATVVAALKAASEKQVHDVGLDSALEQQGLLVDSYREKLQNLSGTLGKLVGGRTAWIDIFKELTMRGVDDTNIEKYATGIKNLAGAMDGDLAGASHTFEAAMAGHYRSLEMMGFQVDKTKDKTAILDDLMQQFAHRGGQMLEERNKTLAASWERLERAGMNFLPALGRIIDDTLHVGVVMEIWSKSLNFVGGALQTTTPKLEGMHNQLPTLAEKLQTAKKGATEAGEAMEGDLSHGADSAKEAADSLAKDGLDTLTKAMGALVEKTREANKELAEARRRADALDDAQLAEDIAKIQAGPGTDAEKAQKEREARHASTDRKQKRQDDEDTQKTATLERQTTGERSIAGGAAKEADDAGRAVYFNKTRQDWVGSHYEDAHKERQGLEDKLAKPVGSKDGYADDPAFAQATVRRHQLDEQMKAWEQETKDLQTALPQLEAVSAARQKVADKARADAEATAKANATQERFIREEQDFRHKLQAKQKETQTVQEGSQDKKRAEEEQRKVDEQTLRSLTAQLREDATLTPDTRAALMKQRNKIEDRVAAGQQQGMPQKVRESTEYNRHNEQKRRDDEELSKRPADAAVIDASQAKDLAAGVGARPNTVTSSAVAMVNQAADRVRQHGGNDEGEVRALSKSLSDLLAVVESRTTVNSMQNTPLGRLRRDVDNILSRMKSL